MTRSIRLALFALLFTLSWNSAEAASDADPLQFGALRFGTTFARSMRPPGAAWSSRRSWMSLDDFYTDEMRQTKSGADVTILCKVQEDGSVLCDLKPGAASTPKPFVDAAIALGERLEVKTVLRDGTPAVGGLIERTIKFAPPR